MSKSPRTPNSSNKKVFKLFSRQNSRKDSPTEKHAPLPTPSHPRLPTRSYSSTRGQANENIPPKLRIDLQINRGDAVAPYTAILEKFPNAPPPPSSRLPRGPLSSSRSLHNLHQNEDQDAPLSPRRPNHRSQSKPRPKGLLIEPEVHRKYFLTNSPAPALDASPAYPFLKIPDLHPPKKSPVVDPLPSVSPKEPAELVDLDDYPWYFVETTDTNTKIIHGLSPQASPLRGEDLCFE